ncbi:hypothetical protein [Gudongella sp. DL1XJH-153]|uniref:hypothetical protein n=1 Tax=Gudongella sp. DL1XJH-153 TaxID=3409804 RepID=UPI003BB4F9D3
MKMMIKNKKRRANGTGTIYRSQDNWVGQITIGRHDDGRLIRKSFTDKTKLGVIKKMEAYRTEMN